MNTTISITTLEEIETDETGRYCYEKVDGIIRCGFFVDTIYPLCEAFGKKLKKKKDRAIRCQPCIDAEIKAAVRAEEMKLTKRQTKGNDLLKLMGRGAYITLTHAGWLIHHKGHVKKINREYVHYWVLDGLTGTNESGYMVITEKGKAYLRELRK